jgi:probable phosphomutase (TIGR03848 family)
VTVLLLIRHAMCDPVGCSIAGRAPGIRLNAEGRRQAGALADALGALPLNAVYSSPLDRAIETAEPLALRLGTVVQPMEELNELDFGDWTGRKLEELEPLPLWRAWNETRGSARIPGGERMADVVGRALEGVDRMRRVHDGELVAAVTHGDVLRGLLAHLLGMPLDLLHLLEVSPASVSVVRFDGECPRITAVNWRAGEGPVQLA